jgi:hypothetical protein
MTGFVGRADLRGLIDQLVASTGGPLVGAGDVRPVLVLEGCGGSGRSTVVTDVQRAWSRRAVIASIDPRTLRREDSQPHPPGIPRPIFPALLLGLSRAVPGFEKVSFRRVVLAHTAMSMPASTTVGRETGELADWVGRRGRSDETVGILASALKFAASHPYLGGTDPGPMIDESARLLAQGVRRSRWVRKLEWRDTWNWFGHLDQGADLDPARVLLELNRKARLTNVLVREDVDDTLTRAFLADLRESMAGIANRPSNAIVLIDDGDDAEAVAFLRSLVRVRRELSTRPGAPDPLTVVVTSSGPLTRELLGLAPGGLRLRESGLGALTGAELGRGPWVSLALESLTRDDVHRLVRERIWQPSLGTGLVASSVHRVTGGHPAAVVRVLQDLQEGEQEKLIDELEAVLERPSSGAGPTVEEHLLTSIVLTAVDDLDSDLMEWLVTLAAARNLPEAQWLVAHTGTKAPMDISRITTASLWSGTDGEGRPVMMTFLRYLLLRRLARRPARATRSWSKVFTSLHRQADTPAARAHHLMALRRTRPAADVLVAQLPVLTGPAWLELLDHAVATPALCPSVPDPDPADDAGAPPEKEYVERLLTHQQLLADPRYNNRARRRSSHHQVARDLERLAGTWSDGLLALMDRAGEARRNAQELS